jgi:hypothetical protein
LDELLNEALEIPVKLIKPLEHPKVGNFELPQGFNAQAMGRIVGMALRCLHMEENPDLWAAKEGSQDAENEATRSNASMGNLIRSLKAMWRALNKPIGK